MANAHDIAAVIINRLGPITALKLEKLVYYSQCWHLARVRTPLFSEPIQAWREGPVVPALYSQHRRQYEVTDWPTGNPDALTDREASTVDWVLSRYRKFSPAELSEMTHAELPWRVARNGLPDHQPSKAEIRQDVMADYYGRQCADPETAVTHAAANAALEGHELDADWLDKLRDVANGTITADKLIAQTIAKATKK